LSSPHYYSGIKRHTIVDTLGLILAVVIQSASVQDRNGGIEAVQRLVENWRKVVRLFADGGYSGTLIEKIKERFKIIVEIIRRDQSHKFKVLPKRWIVERTFAWIDTNRRNSKNYERLN
jgi:putative transposase